MLIQSLEQRYQPPGEVTDRDVIVMLSYGATKDTPDVSGMGQLSGSSANRLLTTVRLHLKTRLPIIISGGQVFSDSGNEAQISKRILMDLGVPDNQIFIDDKSLTTTENALYTKEILLQHGFNSPILVASGFHMPRVVMNFERVGMDVLPYPADYRVSRTTHLYFNKFSPSSGALSNSGTALREYLGIAALRFKAQ
ncbi:YdcF family protein [Sporomusa acidovorans]|nr:YdcF family protein [Sporomusa acidovorans]